MRRILRLMAPLIVLLGLVSACGTAAPGASGPFTLVWGKETDPAGINPLKAGDIHAFEIFSLVYEPLTQPNEDLSVGPGVAKSWTQTAPTTWRFTLRDGVTFSNGRPLTSADVAGTWQAYKETGVLTTLFPSVTTMTAVDPLTVDVTLNAPTPELPNMLEALWVLPAKELADGSFNPDKQLLGSGPYVSDKHVQGVSWTFKANPHYWRKSLPKARTVDIKFIPDDASRLAALRTGEVDFVMTANPDVQTILGGDPNMKVVVQPTTDMYFLVLNPNWAQGKLKDKRVRQAIALAIDHKQIIDTALGGLGEITGIMPKQFEDACDPAGVLGATKPDVAKAKALLREAGVSGLSFKLSVVPAFGAIRAPQMAEVIQQNLKEIGVDVQVASMEAGAWLDEVITKGTFDATLNWYTGGGSSSYMLSKMDPVRTPSIGKSITQDPQALSLLRTALALPFGPEHTKAAAAACDALNDQATFIPLATKPTVIVYRTDRIAPVFNKIEPVQMTFRNLAEFGRAA
jgi:peptide/nickel transport system substrate-binding protein